MQFKNREQFDLDNLVIGNKGFLSNTKYIGTSYYIIAQKDIKNTQQIMAFATYFFSN